MGCAQEEYVFVCLPQNRCISSLDPTIDISCWRVGAAMGACDFMALYAFIGDIAPLRICYCTNTPQIQVRTDGALHVDDDCPNAKLSLTVMVFIYDYSCMAFAL